MSYIDGFVIPVPKANKAAYRELAEWAAVIFKEHGALRIVECWGDDIPPGKLTSFPLAVQCAADETVVFSWIVWPSREARDAGNARFMADPRMLADKTAAPFNPKRMIFGGFEVMLEV